MPQNRDIANPLSSDQSTVNKELVVVKKLLSFILEKKILIFCA